MKVRVGTVLATALLLSTSSSRVARGTCWWTEARAQLSCLLAPSIENLGCFSNRDMPLLEQPLACGSAICIAQVGEVFQKIGRR